MSEGLRRIEQVELGRARGSIPNLDHLGRLAILLGMLGFFFRVIRVFAAVYYCDSEELAHIYVAILGGWHPA